MKMAIGMAAGVLGMAVLGAAGCTHLKGVVVDQQTQRPIATAVFTEGLPGGDFPPRSYPVKGDGTFEFDTMVDFEKTGLYVWRAPMMGAPAENMRRISKGEAGPNMVVGLPPQVDFKGRGPAMGPGGPGGAGGPMGPGGAGTMPGPGDGLRPGERPPEPPPPVVPPPMTPGQGPRG